MDTKSWFPMEITDFMGLLPPKSFTTDRLAKIYFCFYFIFVFSAIKGIKFLSKLFLILSYFSGRTKIIPCPKQLFSIGYYVLTDVTNYAFPVLLRRYSGFMQNR